MSLAVHKGASLPVKKRIKLIHTSDIHLGDEVGHPAANDALQALVRSVPSLEGDLLLLVGDIFDNGRVGDEVLEFFLDQMARLPVPAVLLPGNHDLYGEGSIYQRQPFSNKPGNLFVLTDTDGQTLSFPELTLNIWGRAMPFHTPDFHPLEGMPAADNGHWLVALAHGHFHYDDDRDQRSSPIYPAEVAQATCDYLALGHWDRHVDVSQGRVKAVYSGAPLGAIQSNDSVAFTLVDLDPEHGVKTRQVTLDMIA